MTWDAILADLDGTLVDTDNQHDQALTNATRVIGGFWDQFYAGQFAGRSTDRLREYAGQRHQWLPGERELDAQVERIRTQKWQELEQVLRDCTADDLDPFGESRQALAMLKSLDLPVLIVTDTPRACAAITCRKLGWSTRQLVTRDEVDGLEKPHPAIYKLARSRVTAQHPVVLEDTLRGAHAASAAQIPSFLVSGPGRVIEWLTEEFPAAASTTTAATKTRSSRRRSGSSTRRTKPRS